MKKFFVIGSSGQIGTALMKTLRARGLGAVGLDMRSNIWDKNLTNIHADFLNYGLSPLNDFTDIVFLATEPSAKRLEADAATNKKNYKTFGRVLDWAQKINARLTIVSSRELFGVEPAKINSFIPQNSYEKQKKDFEAQLYNPQKKGLAYGVFRVPIVFGGNDTDLERLPRLVPRWCEQALSGKKIELAGGETKIELAFIEDVINKMVETLLNENSSFLKEIRGIVVKLNDLVDTIQAVVRREKQKNGAVLDTLRKGILATIESLKNQKSQ